MVRLVVLLQALALASPVLAKPDLDAAEARGGYQVFPDHRSPRVFYYAPTSLRMSVSGGKPDFHFSRNRYAGRSVTGDSGEWRSRGVLSFAVEVDAGEDKFKALAEGLRRDKGRAVDLQPMPVSGFDSHLTYVVIDSQDGQNEEGEVKGGVTEEEPAPILRGWRKRRFTIGLQRRTTELFWDAFGEDRLVLSLAYNWRLAGVHRGEDGHWQDATRDLAGELAIRMSRRQYPGLFSKNDLNQTISAEYRKLAVQCYDFIDGLAGDIDTVRVSLRSPTINGFDEEREAIFTRGDAEYQVEVAFDLPRDPTQPLRYRVIRESPDGKEEGPWIRHEGNVFETSLDVSTILE
jgi:hypothetical protein